MGEVGRASEVLAGTARAAAGDFHLFIAGWMSLEPHRGAVLVVRGWGLVPTANGSRSVLSLDQLAADSFVCGMDEGDSDLCRGRAGEVAPQWDVGS